ncbi:MAG: bifunctional 4-hydroxy-2-oxoglutarate aldolase/2-dehydro-3-deoxy-phosphogluconate aldolase, partial [Chloroflexi bacterium]|nr:bifunctional 4-hydroxy-2-oxoglutarate aldolase/2-dehydro-3-deoxy-phosphogluconate aldolase [Chloroflexota bacterium]
LDAGLPCAEITFRTAAAEDCIRAIAHAYPQIIPGAGTVLTAEQAERAVRGGARYIVSPGFDVRVVDWCLARQVPVMPGVATPTEILMALDKGISLLKFFPPAALGGVRMLEALAAVFGGVRFVPTGGVTADNLPNYQKLASVFAVGGTWLVSGKSLAAGAIGEVTRPAREAVETMARERAHGGGQ